MRPVVPFEQPIEIGDVGSIGSDGAWNPISTTGRRFNVAPADIRTTKDGSGIWSASSGNDVSFKAYAEGAVSQLVSSVADARARAEITFESSSSFVFAARNVTIRSATEVGDVIEAIRRAYHERDTRPESERWYKDYLFVFAVGDADRFTAMLANHKGTTVAVTASGKAGHIPVTPAGLAAGVNIGISSTEVTRIHETRAKGRLPRVPACAVDSEALGLRGVGRGPGDRHGRSPADPELRGDVRDGAGPRPTAMMRCVASPACGRPQRGIRRPGLRILRTAAAPTCPVRSTRLRAARRDATRPAGPHPRRRSTCRRPVTGRSRSPG